MSLFKVRDCWSTVCGRGEIFGCDALAVDDLFGAGEDNIVLGSFDGVLRVYGVHAAPPPDFRYSPSDLLIEAQMDSPVLQVCTGKLIRSVYIYLCSNTLWTYTSQLDSFTKRSSTFLISTAHFKTYQVSIYPSTYY